MGKEIGKIGITGGIGSGKSMVCSTFRILGIPIFDADTEAKKLYDEDSLLKEQIIASFGKEIYDAKGFNRKKMGDLVFHSPEKLKLLNEIVHPLVENKFQKWTQSQKSLYIIKEAAILIESNSYKNLNKVILVTAPIEKRIERVKQRDNTTYDEVVARIKKQLSDEEKRKYCDFEIKNDETTLLIPQILALHSQFLEEYS